ncbi:MAG: RNA polymerase sigma factor [Bacteroidota bacterium]
MKERDLIEALRTGDSLAYSQLLDDYQQKVFSTCISFVPNRQDAEDISQEVFVEVFSSINKFKGKSKLGTWIYRIAVNKSLEFIRKRNTKKRFGFMQSLSGNVVPVDRSSYFTEFNHPGIQLENKERTEVLFRAIDQLPEAQKIIFTLHRIDGLSHQEVAEITQKSISSVESVMFRAKKNLQKILYNYYKNDDP